MTTSAQSSKTPILDLYQPLPVPIDQSYSNRSLYVWLTIALFAFATGDVIVPFFLLWAILIWWLKVAVHEFGHLLAAWLVGLRLESIAVGSVWLVREEGSFRFRWKRQYFMGQVNVGLDRLCRIRSRLIVVSLGGPVATLLSAIIVMGIPIFWSSEFGNFAPGFSDFSIYIFAIFSILSLCVNLYPRDYAGVPNDVLAAKILLTSSAKAKRMIATYALHMQTTKGVDPINLNRRWISLCRPTDSEPQAEYCKNWERYTLTLNDDPELAANYLEQCLAGSAILRNEQRDHLICEAAFFSASRRKSIANADKWFAKISDQAKLPLLQTLRVKTEIQRAKRNYSSALAYCDEALYFLRSFPRSSPARDHEASWTHWRQTIEHENAQAVA